MKANRKAGLSHYDKPNHNGCNGYRPNDMFLNHEHELALMDGTLYPWEDPLCDNCGWKFPPCEIWQEDRYIYCARWDTQKEKSRCCKAWTREGHASCKPPFWCSKDRSRLSQTEIHNNHKPNAVRLRLSLSDKQRPIKRIRKLQDQHIQISGSTCSKLKQPLSNKERWRLYSRAIRDMERLDNQIAALKRELD